MNRVSPEGRIGLTGRLGTKYGQLAGRCDSSGRRLAAPRPNWTCKPTLAAVAPTNSRQRSTYVETFRKGAVAALRQHKSESGRSRRIQAFVDGDWVALPEPRRRRRTRR
jgi:hypothetical protein